MIQGKQLASARQPGTANSFYDGAVSKTSPRAQLCIARVAQFAGICLPSSAVLSRGARQTWRTRLLTRLHPSARQPGTAAGICDSADSQTVTNTVQLHRLLAGAVGLTWLARVVRGESAAAAGNFGIFGKRPSQASSARLFIGHGPCDDRLAIGQKFGARLVALDAGTGQRLLVSPATCCLGGICHGDLEGVERRGRLCGSVIMFTGSVSRERPPWMGINPGSCIKRSSSCVKGSARRGSMNLGDADARLKQHRWHRPSDPCPSRPAWVLMVSPGPVTDP